MELSINFEVATFTNSQSKVNHIPMLLSPSTLPSD